MRPGTRSEVTYIAPFPVTSHVRLVFIVHFRTTFSLLELDLEMIGTAVLNC